MTEPTPDQTHAPLTPAQVEVLDAWLAERRLRIEEEIDAKVAAAIEPLHEAIAQLKEDVQQAIKYGAKIGLRAANGMAICAAEGGPTAEHQPFQLVAREAISVWESFDVERGTS